MGIRKRKGKVEERLYVAYPYYMTLSFSFPFSEYVVEIRH
jgi:hypothetical protein